MTSSSPRRPSALAQADPLCMTNVALLDVTSAANKQLMLQILKLCSHDRVEYTAPARNAAPACKSGSGCSCLVSAGFGGRAWRQLAFAGKAYWVALLACDCSTVLLVCIEPMLSPTSPAKWQACHTDLIAKAYSTGLIKPGRSLSDEGAVAQKAGRQLQMVVQLGADCSSLQSER